MARLVTPCTRVFLLLVTVAAASLLPKARADAARELRLLSSGSFVMGVDPANGSIARLSHPGDEARMNWVTSAFDAPWQTRSTQWGLGYADVGATALHRGRWELPESLKVDDRSVHVIYRVGALRIEVTRELVDDALTERYVFTNTGSEPLSLANEASGAFAIYTPFNDNYTTAEDSLERRAHAHLWCGGTTAWVCALRMGGRAPHLGLVLTEGAISAYSVTGRDAVTASSTRGVLLLHPDAQALAPGASTTVAWTLFWHNGWEDFFSQCARRSQRFVRFEASKYAIGTDETVEISVVGATELFGEALKVGASIVPLKGEGKERRAVVRPITTGEVHCEFSAAGGIKTSMQLNVVPSLADLVAARVWFIVEHQQVNAAGDTLDGAFLVYDNERGERVRGDRNPDLNEARERIGMGVLLARWLRGQVKRNERIMGALERYYNFVSHRLQREDGTVLDGVGGGPAALRNWPWVMQLHLEVARLTGDRVPLRRFVRTVEKFYNSGGIETYPIGLPVLDGLRALDDAAWKNDYDHLRAYFSQHAERIAANGVNYPNNVGFAQDVVASAAIFLLEMHRATGEPRWLEAARPQVQCLELFNGRQPDHRLHDIAIRHSDGYAFGKSRMWGDTFPQHWSTLTAVAYYHYAQAVKDARYAGRARQIVQGNLSLFSHTGRAACAYLYPLTVDGRAGKFADAYANDQDWALVDALAIAGE